MNTPDLHPGILSPDTTLIILTWVSFFFLLVILHRFAWKPILEGLKVREEYIRKSLDDADQIKNQLAEVEVTKLRIIEEAKEAAKVEAEKVYSGKMAELSQEAERARSALRDRVAELAVAGAEKILRREVNAGAHADMLAALKQEL